MYDAVDVQGCIALRSQSVKFDTGRPRNGPAAQPEVGRWIRGVAAGKSPAQDSLLENGDDIPILNVNFPLGHGDFPMGLGQFPVLL